MLGELTTLEVRILASLTEPQTSTELFENLGIGYPYGIKVIRKMKHKKLIDHQQRGTYTYYFTIRTSETEDIFAAKAQSTGKTEYLFPFRGEWSNLSTVAKKLDSMNRDVDLLKLAKKILYNLQYNSYRKEQNMPTQRPYSDDMRRKLENKLQQARMDVQFVEEILKAPIWNDSKSDWKTISTLAPSMETGKTNSEELNTLIYKK
jgi:hypothetical protein